MKIYDVLTTIQNTASSSSKKQILKDNLNTIISDIFYDTYGKQKYYIKTFNPLTNSNGLESGTLTLDNNYDLFHKQLLILSNREITGKVAYSSLQEIVSRYDEESIDILCRIINRNLKIGLSLDNFLNIVGGKESKYEVALAENLNKVKGVNPIDGTYFISRKLDGARCVCFVHQYMEGERLIQEVEFKSRQNKPILTLNNLIDDVKVFTSTLGEGDFVLDGEVCIVDENGDENFQGLMKEISRKDYTIENPRYKVFDLLTLDEFWMREPSMIFSKRYELLLKMELAYKNPRHNKTPNKKIDVVTQERVTNQYIFDNWINKAKENDWEGCMLRKDVEYKKGRSKDLLKIKGMQDAEYIVVDVEYGKATYNEDGAKEYDVVSALIIEHKGNKVKVGSGISKKQRLEWYNNPEIIKGKTITVQYFEETQDSKTGEFSLRFPVLKYVYENGRDF